MLLNELLLGLRQQTLDFEDAQAFIAANYDYQPAAFQNGNQHNAAGTNEGSCRILRSVCLLNFQQKMFCYALVAFIVTF